MPIEQTMLMKREDIKNRFVSMKEACIWASEFLGRSVTIHNIQYLTQYAKITKHFGSLIDLGELKNYYEDNIIRKQDNWKSSLGNDVDWGLSFSHLRESDTTKHVHRLHPYKGKFIPQLVEYFLDEHINTHKKEIFFKSGDTVLDPFAGSGTTLIQSCELGLNSIGIDISEFNCLISKVKSENYNFDTLAKELLFALNKVESFSMENFDNQYELELKEKLSVFNNEYFPSVEFKKKVITNKINERNYASKKLNLFVEKNRKLLKKDGIRLIAKLQNERIMSGFLAEWFSTRVKQELFYYLSLIGYVKDEKIKDVMRLILSRTARSCRATTHSDLATLKEPQIGPYYCNKHQKLCIPINNIIKHLRGNTYDTIRRLRTFSGLKRITCATILNGDSRTIDIFEAIKMENPLFYNSLIKKKIDGVFTSPPYVGQIDYHEQHAYAYELLNINRKDGFEIGPLSAGKGEKAKNSYVEGISQVFRNVSRFLKDDANLFIVANDKYNLYPIIAEKSGFKIVNQFKRPVLNRTERDRHPYAEIIFHMKKINSL